MACASARIDGRGSPQSSIPSTYLPRPLHPQTLSQNCHQNLHQGRKTLLPTDLTSVSVMEDCIPHHPILAHLQLLVFSFLYVVGGSLCVPVYHLNVDPCQ